MSLPTGLKCRIPATGYQTVIGHAPEGHIVINPDALNKSKVDRIYRWVISARGGDIWRRQRELLHRVSIFSDRPLGSTPVRAGGVQLFGGAPVRPRSGWTPAQQRWFESRAIKIDNLEANWYSYWSQKLKATSDPAERVILEWELHQALTGGGYDNGEIYGIFGTALRFADIQSKPPAIDSRCWEYIVQACNDLTERLIQQGMKLHSLDPVPYPRVRADQNNDGTIGWPINERGTLPFSEKQARAIKAAYGVDLSSHIGEVVVDPDTGYQGKFRNQDAVAALLDELTVSIDNCYPLVNIFARIQRHGYKIEGDALHAKDGKLRAVFVPDAVHGGIGAMVGQAFQDVIMSIKFEDMPSLMNPDDQAEAVYSLVLLAKKLECYVLSTDESQYDATLTNSILCTIIDRCIRPFFKPEWDAWIDATIVSIAYKVLIFPSSAMDVLTKDLAPDMVGLSKSAVLVFCLQGGLISGHKLTHILGSFGVQVFQRVTWYIKGDSLPPGHRYGVSAGDDNAMLVRKAWCDLSTMESAYGFIEEIANSIGLQVNPNKQIHITYEDEPLTIFLQRAYMANLDIKGEGSAARPLAGAFFSEYTPRLNMAQQILGQMAVMNNSATSRFKEDAVRLWLEQDPLLVYIFQTKGSEAWRWLIDQAGGVDWLLSIPETGAYAFAVDSEALSKGEPLPIVEVAITVARTMDPIDEEKAESFRQLAVLTEDS